MKHLLLLAFGLLAWSPVWAQSEPLPPLADYPTDLRLPARGAHRMQWTSTGSATWSLELSTNLVNWSAYTNLETSLPAGETEDLQVGLPAPVSELPQYVRLTHRHAPPRIVTPPFNLGRVADFFHIISPSYPYLARVDGDFPLLTRWYAGGQLVATQTNTHDAAIDLGYLYSGPLGSGPGGAISVTVANPWGGVTTQAVQAPFIAWPEFAPTNIMGRVLELDVQFQSLVPEVITIGPPNRVEVRFVVPARYRLRAASQGNACEIEGLSGIRGGPGTYEYGIGHENQNPGGIIILPSSYYRHTAHLIFQTTSPEGGLFETHGLLTFRSATNGTFRLQDRAGTIAATGEFGFVE